MAPSPCADKGSFGSAPYPVSECLICACSGAENCPLMLCGSAARRNLEVLADTAIGSSALPLPRRLLWPRSNASSGMTPFMLSCPGQNLRPSIVQRRKPELKVLGNGAPDPFAETPRPTGSRSGVLRNKETFYRSPPVFVWCLIGHLELLERTIWRVDLLFVKFGYSGDQQVNTK